MSNPASDTHYASARRGLTTVAFLKARFDAGADHLGMFQPFVEDAIFHSVSDEIDLTSIQKAINQSTGLRIPTDVIKTLLKRSKKKGLVTRAGGRYLRTHRRDPTAFHAQMNELEVATERLAKRLSTYATDRDHNFASDDDALSALTHFLDFHHIGMVLGQDIRVGASRTSSRNETVIASFVREIVEEGGRDSDVLDSIVKGLIVQNALLLRDVPIAGRHLSRLTVYLDSGILLRALGYAGSTELYAATEALSLLRAAGASLCAFDGTVAEVESILRVYEHKLGSSAGIRELRSTPLTHHFLSIKATPAELHQELALIPLKLDKLDVLVRPFPKHTHDYTEDERSLAEILRNPSKNRDDDARVWHDVMAIAAILTLREGARPSTMANARYVLASGSSRTVDEATAWYRKSYTHGLEPMVHFRSVTNAAWVLRPGEASNMPMHQLVTVCAALLQPSVEIWNRFVAHLEYMVASGELSDDDSIAVVASDFTRIALGDLDSDDDVEATTVREIVDRVRAEEQAEFTSRLDKEKRQRRNSERETVAARLEVAEIKRTALSRSEGLASIVAGGIYGVVVILIALGAFWTLPTDWSLSAREHDLWRTAWWVCVSVFACCSLLGFTNRFHVLNLYSHLRRWLASRFRRVLLPERRPANANRILDL